MSNMDKQISLSITDPAAGTPEKEAKAERMLKAEKKRQQKEFQPSWHQVWVTGYPMLTTGKHKNGIFEMKNSTSDIQKLKEIKKAIEDGEIGKNVEDMKKFSKSHALNLYRELMEIRKADIIKEYIANIPDNYHSVQEWSDLVEMVELAKLHPEDAVDTETTGLHLENDEVVGMSITLPHADQHYYIPFLHQNWNVGHQLDKKKVMEYLQQELWGHDGRLTAMFNAKFDLHMLLKEGITFEGKVVDALEGMMILNENEQSYALKKLANKWGKYFGFTDDSLTFEQLFSRDPKDFYINADYRLCYYYACKDTHLTWRFWEWQQQQMLKQPKLDHVFHSIETPITRVCVDMEQNGMPIDLEYSKKYKKQLECEIAELDKRIRDFFGDINFNSPAQLQAKLFDELGLEPLSEKRSVDAAALKQLSKVCPELKLLMEYRKKNKLLSSFISPIPEMVWADQRIHGSFNQGGTKTGRFASDKPNMQNLPYPARPMFKAPEGKLIIGIDFSQIEPRVLAHMSHDPSLQEPYIEGRDLYATTATMVYGKKYGLKYEQCLEADDESWRKIPQLSKHPRKLFKQGLLSVMYETSDYSLAKLLDIPLEEGTEFINDFHHNFPIARQYADESIAFVDSHGYAETMDGRKRRFLGHVKVAKRYEQLKQAARNMLGHVPEGSIWAEKSLPFNFKKEYGDIEKSYNSVLRQVVNARTQGSAADIMKKAMIQLRSKLKELCQETGENWLLVGTIHDEVLIEVPQTITAEQFTDLEGCMLYAVTLDIPLKVDTEVSIRWGQGVPKAEYLESGLDCWTPDGWLPDHG